MWGYSIGQIPGSVRRRDDASPDQAWWHETPGTRGRDLDRSMSQTVSSPSSLNPNFTAVRLWQCRSKPLLESHPTSQPFRFLQRTMETFVMYDQKPRNLPFSSCKDVLVTTLAHRHRPRVRAYSPKVRTGCITWYVPNHFVPGCACPP